MSLDFIGKNPYRQDIAFRQNDGYTDAFGRLRVSNPETLFDSKQIYDNQPLFWDDEQVSGSGTTSVHSTALAATTLGVSTATGKRVRQTFQSFNYKPGKSQLIFMTGVMRKSGASNANIKRGIGIYNDNNGLFFLDDEGIIKVVVRTSTSGSPVDNEVAQADWNIDKLDGTGESGITLDLTKSQIFVIDFEWLGVGTVRFGFEIDGMTYYVHQFRNANNLNTVYMSTPNLPLRYEIENTGGGVASTMDHICTTVISEGGQEKNSIVRTITNDQTLKKIKEDDNVMLFALRLKSAYVGATIELVKIAALSVDNNLGRWGIYLNPTLTGPAFTYTGLANSAIEFGTQNFANDAEIDVTGGTLVQAGFFSEKESTITQLNDNLRLGVSIDGTRDVLVFAVFGITNDLDMRGALTFRELL